MLSLVVLAKLVWSLIVLAWPFAVLLVFVYPLVVILFPLVVLVFPLAVLVCPFVVLVCPLVVLVVLSVGLFITDPCFTCEGEHSISICDEHRRTRDHSSRNIQKQSPSTAEIETQTNLNDTPCNVLLQTAVANAYVWDKSESRAFRLLFDSGAQLIHVSPKVKAFLGPEIKAKKEVVLKTFGENTSHEILVVELILASKTADEDIKLQAFVLDICHPLKN